jgi:hypothetical protein
MPWFTDYPYGDFAPHKRECCYNETFATQLTLITTAFQLKRASRGVHVSTGFRRPCTFQDKNVHIEVKKFSWWGINRYREYITPVFRLDVVMREDAVHFFKNLFWEGNFRPFFQGQVVVEFSPNYPQAKPHLRIDDPRYTPTSTSAAHHIYSGGWLCIMAGGGFWQPKTCTILTALDAAFDWIVWHTQTFPGKGVNDA